MHVVFIGEKRSPTAVKRGWTWSDGRLAGKTLQDALAAMGWIYGTEYVCDNLWTDTGTIPPDMRLRLGAWLTDGWLIVGMGEKVSRLLERWHVPHRRMVHPAARGAIRQRAEYQRHVRQVLTIA